MNQARGQVVRIYEKSGIIISYEAQSELPNYKGIGVCRIVLVETI